MGYRREKTRSVHRPLELDCKPLSLKQLVGLLVFIIQLFRPPWEVRPQPVWQCRASTSKYTFTSGFSTNKDLLAPGGNLQISNLVASGVKLTGFIISMPCTTVCPCGRCYRPPWLFQSMFVCLSTKSRSASCFSLSTNEIAMRLAN